MQIPLNQFEQYIDETILKRGLDYFKSGYVYPPEEINQGKYEAIVAGTQEYLVQITIENKIITDHYCDCPYDYGPICKHVVAVLFELQQDVLELTQITSSNKKKTQRKKRKTLAQQVDELLEKASHDELKLFVRKHTEYNIDFRNIFLSSFSHLSSEESVKMYKKQIQSILKAASDRHGFIAWNMTGTVGVAVDSLLGTAEEQVDKGNFKTAFYICVAIMEKMTEALQYADDSNGDIGGPIYAATELLHRIAREQSDEKLRSSIMDYCFSAVDQEIYSGWDTEFDLLLIASKIIKTDEDKNRLLNELDFAARSEYTRELAQDIKYDILLQTESKEVAAAYLIQHIGNSRLRRKAIQSALGEKAFAQAKTLAKDGIKYDNVKKPGLVKEWYSWLLKIAETEEDSEKIIEYARLLYLDGYGHNKEWYTLMRENVPQEDWEAYVEALLKEIQEGNPWLNKNKAAEIYIEEKQWYRLMKIVRDSPDLSTLDTYSKYLVKDYADEIADSYVGGIKGYLEMNMGRKHYKKACQYLRKVINLGAKDKAEEAIAFLREKYHKRPALMEELSKV